MVVITRRQLNEGAVLPVSEEVVEHVVDLKRKAIADNRLLLILNMKFKNRL